MTVTVATRDWTETYRTKKDDGLLGYPAKIHGLSMQAMAIAESGADSIEDAAVPSLPNPTAFQHETKTMIPPCLLTI